MLGKLDIFPDIYRKDKTPMTDEDENALLEFGGLFRITVFLHSIYRSWLF